MIRILFASRLVQEKGVDILIECIEYFSQDKELSKKITWTICSDGNEQETIIKLSKKHKNVTYLGKVSQEKMKKLYQESTLLFMPSRFLETFGLTALEAISLGVPVCGPMKGGLRDFVAPELSLDEENPIHSFQSILEKIEKDGYPHLPDISHFSYEKWLLELKNITNGHKNILLIHDYHERIGGAEQYRENLEKNLKKIGKNVSFFGYQGSTSIWKRRILFIFSIFSFWRWIQLAHFMEKEKPDMIWMHSILRYIGPWGILAVRKYSEKHHTKLIICHHDLGLISAFPQDISDESMIPLSDKLVDFIPKNASISKKVISIPKWSYVHIIKYLLPASCIQMIFSGFLRKSIRSHFGEDREIILFRHTTTEE